ncbi:MAG: hotdog domain-containing protein [Undibacterium sp.]|uniref:hotdog domain-containing protein n=1 Tax=Undibacterium sp. TaxID=1914977 RepID=UPI00271E87CF|nr:hotdog domain-containing protein [Undibacterium sp.]MDO8650835.1 hotdog domain-containing protein [Undibacterium sp.]
MFNLFGDVATELLIRSDGDEGLFVAYDNVQFMAPVYAGDYIEATGRIVAMGKTSRKMEFKARKVIASPVSAVNWIGRWQHLTKRALFWASNLKVAMPGRTIHAPCRPEWLKTRMGDARWRGGI